MNTAHPRDLQVAYTNRLADADHRSRPGLIRDLAGLSPVEVVARRVLRVDHDDAVREDALRDVAAELGVTP